MIDETQVPVSETPIVPEESESGIWIHVEKSLRIHKVFDNYLKEKAKVNNGEAVYSFHNEKHVKAVLTAVGLYFGHLEGSKDPLHFQKDLQAFNEEFHGDGNELSLEEAVRLTLYAFANHDMGNILEKEDGAWVRRDQYVSAGAEEVSVDYALDHLADAFGSDDDDKKLEVYQDFVKQMILKTKLNADKDELFYRFAQVMDQVGNSFVNHQPDKRFLQVLGLLDEWSREENAGPEEISLHDMFNFAVRSLIGTLDSTKEDDEVTRETRRQVEHIFFGEDEEARQLATKVIKKVRVGEEELVIKKEPKPVDELRQRLAKMWEKVSAEKGPDEDKPRVEFVFA